MVCCARRTTMSSYKVQMEKTVALLIDCVETYL